MEPRGMVGIGMVARSTMQRVARLAVGASLLVAGSALAQMPAPAQDEQAADTEAWDPAEQPDFSVLNEPLPDVGVRGASRTPFPIRSEKRAPKTSAGVEAMAKRGFESAARP